MAFTADQVLDLLDSSKESELKRTQGSCFLMRQTLNVKSLFHATLFLFTRVPNQLPVRIVTLQMKIV